MFLRLSLYLALLNSTIEVSAQDKLNNKLWQIEYDQSLEQFLSGVERQSKLKFYYLKEWLEPFTLTPQRNTGTLKEILSSVLEGTDIGFVFLYDYAIVFYKDPLKELERNAVMEAAVNNQIKVDESVFGSVNTVGPNKRVKLYGSVIDKETNLPIVGASVHLTDLEIDTQTDLKGQYEFDLPVGEYILTLRHINYEIRLLSLKIYEDGVLKTVMDEKPTTLEAVIISDQIITTKRIGLTALKMNELTRSPNFLGETDVIKTLLVQTGVSAVSEASTGYNVRGGGVDQNLVLYDGVPILNTGHAFGFFSAFNTDAVKDASFYKSSISAEYGGRVSSVLSMTSREGNYYKWKGNAGISFVSTNLTVEGPLKHDTSSLILSIRTTYSDWILNLLQTKFNDIKQSEVSFYDGSIKYTQKLKNGAKFLISSYASHDRFSLSNDTVNSWQNFALAARYDHQRNQQLYYSIGLYLGSYSYQVSETDPPTAFDLTYKVFYPSIKIDFNRDRSHKQSFGLQTTFYKFKPGQLTAKSPESNIHHITMPDENSVETGLYFSESFYWGERLNVDAGLRISIFNRIGYGLEYRYKPNEPLEPRNVLDSIQYRAGDIIKTYWGPEPRIAIQYMLTPLSSVKFGYNRIYQYVHLVTNSAAVTPVDIWQSSNTYFKPQRADQVSVGYFRTSKRNIIDGFIELYFKSTQNILDFKDGASLILNPKLETDLLLGTGVAYGVEVSLDKMKGRILGGINYTYARSFRRVNGKYESEKINNGNYYSSNIDQPHIVNFNWRYSLKRNVFFSGLFTYRTGRPVSLPIAAYEVDNTPVIDFSERNNYRLKDYHRLDLALIIEGGNKRKKNLSGHWTFSIYNAYGRKNPYSAFFVYNVSGSVKPYQLSLIGIPVPSIGYTVKF